MTSSIIPLSRHCVTVKQRLINNQSHIIIHPSTTVPLHDMQVQVAMGSPGRVDPGAMAPPLHPLLHNVRCMARGVSCKPKAVNVVAALTNEHGGCQYQITVFGGLDRWDRESYLYLMYVYSYVL